MKAEIKVSSIKLGKAIFKKSVTCTVTFIQPSDGWTFTCDKKMRIYLPSTKEEIFKRVRKLEAKIMRQYNNLQEGRVELERLLTNSDKVREKIELIDNLK